MKLSPVAQTPLEWIALKAGLVPTPLAYSHFGFMMSKFLLEAVDKGVFEAIGYSKLTIEQISSACSLNARALTSLMRVLASMGLVMCRNNQFRLTAKSKKWILKDSPGSLYWLMMFDNKVCFKWMDHTGTFLETGKGLQYHETLGDDEWFYYQKAMEAVAWTVSKEVTRKIHMPAGAANMLDIGGSHGLYSQALCKKNSGLSSVILDLPQAVEKSKPALEKSGLQNQITYRAGNVLTDDIGKDKFDIVLMANVAHHFTMDENRQVAAKAFRALKQGGVFIIMEVLRSDDINNNSDMLSALGDFFFALSSTSGAWSLNEIRQWQKEAGFKPGKKTSFLTIPGYSAISAIKAK